MVHFWATPRTRPLSLAHKQRIGGVPYSIGISSLQRITSSLQYENRTFTARVTFRERSHTIVRALDGRLSRKENERQRVSTRSTGTGSYVEFIDTALALANYAV